MRRNWLTRPTTRRELILYGVWGIPLVAIETGFWLAWVYGLHIPMPPWYLFDLANALPPLLLLGAIRLRVDLRDK